MSAVSLAFRTRGILVAGWSALFLVVGWPPGRPGTTASLVPLVLGISLRLWARRHAGAHTRLSVLAAPYRATGGPYAWLRHPLYTANLLVLGALGWRWFGLGWFSSAHLVGPGLLYAFLGRAEERFLDRASPPESSVPVEASDRRFLSEWASVLPPLFLWWWSRP